uniref:maleylacetoacetate isomerase n=1 Tax=Phenylobacterium sp. TaxID=1871053 RepID=UPI0028127F8B
MAFVLHSYWRATAPYRVRIGLNLKGLPYDYAPVNLLKAEQNADTYAGLNRQELLPALQTGDGQVLTQSLAILEWLEEVHPEPALLPKDPFERATVRAMAAIVACDIHPLNNLRIQKQLTALGVDDAGRTVWTQRWINDGFRAL